jgi:hypothetical protein
MNQHLDRIDDNELILYRYRDGLPAARIATIDAALRRSPELRARYECLCLLLSAADQAPVPTPDPQFEARLWNRLEAQIATPAASGAPAFVPRTNAHARRRRRQSTWQLGIAAAAMLVLAVGFYAGRLSVPVQPTAPIAAGEADDPLLAAKVLNAYVAEHLRATEGVLLTAINSDSGELAAGNAELAAALVDSNRLYAAAAIKAGNPRLADFLRQMEPVLIELANPPPGGGVEIRNGLRDYVRTTDLLFQVRATEARLESRGNDRA